MVLFTGVGDIDGKGLHGFKMGQATGDVYIPVEVPRGKLIPWPHG